MLKNKNGVDYYTQSDSRWKNEIMTFPIWQQKPDTIGEYFCLLTSLINIYNDYANKDITPKDFNQMIIEDNGYNYLQACLKYKKEDDIKKACYGKESFVDWDTIIKLLNIKQVVRNYKGYIDLSIANEYYIIKVPYSTTGHYCNIVRCPKKTFYTIEYFDVYDAIIKKPKDILEVIKIVF